MVQQVIITSETSVALKPLLEAAIRSEMKMLEYGIRRTREQLAKFENQHGMKSEEFERRFKAREIGETLEFIDWWMEVEALHMLEGKYQALHNVRLG